MRTERQKIIERSLVSEGSNVMKQKKRIVLTGGGTAGHVTPNIALLPLLKEHDYEVFYIGSKTGIEKELITEQEIPYYEISSGKLRRYLDVKNFTDPFRVIKGYAEAKHLMKKLKPDVVFSKGGFVSVPVVFAARKYNIPVIIHESDMTPGLANKLAIPKAEKVCCNFPETKKYLPEGKAVVTGSPIRAELMQGSRERGLKLCGFSEDKPTVMVVGGSKGSVHVNEVIREALPELLKRYQVVHLCGYGNKDEELENKTGYKQFEYVKGELRHIFAAAEVVVSRAGANSICELVALKKPNVLIPLPLSASRGDQLLNAASFEKQGFSFVVKEEDADEPFNAETVIKAVDSVYSNREKYIEAMEKSNAYDAVSTIFSMINDIASGNA